MSTTGKLGIVAISSMFAAYVLGSRLEASNPFGTWRTYLAAAALLVCVTVFIRQLFSLQDDLKAIDRAQGPLRRRDGTMFLP